MKTHGRVTRTVVGLVALALSGIAAADHKPGHDKGKGQGQGPGPKVSVDITNLCEFGDGTADNPIPVNILRVTTTVEDVSDDPRRAVDVESVTTKGLQFVEPVDPPKKDKWKAVGAEVARSETPIDLYTIRFVRDIDVCQLPVLEDAAKALNAHVQVKLPDGEVFMRMCDNPFLEGDDLDGDGNDDVDQSRIDLDNFDPSESCAN